MIMFDNKTKPELEAGNYIAYADEPNTIVSGSGGGGGGVAVFRATAEQVGGNWVEVVDFTYNDIIAEAENKPVFLIDFDQGNALCWLLVAATSTGGTYTVALKGSGANDLLFTALDPDQVMVAREVS